jgi:hypothetical protein
MNPPKPRHSSFLSQMFFWLSLLTLLAIVGSFFGLTYLTAQRQKEYNSLNAQLAQEETPDQKALEISVLGYKQKLQDFSKVLNAHTSSSRFFTSLEQLVYPNVYFDNLILNPMDRTAVISGKVDSFQSLAKQVVVFKKATQVFDGATLAKIDMGSDGKIEFTINATIRPDAIIYK